MTARFELPRNGSGLPMLTGMRRDPEICTWSECGATHSNFYCRRCIISLKQRLVPGMTAREIEGFYTEIGRERALTEAESVVLEDAVRVPVRRNRAA